MFNKLADIRTKLCDVLSMLRKLVCIGEVSIVDAQLRRVKVTFPGLRYPESDWLPVLGMRSKNVSISCNLEVGEQVLCLFIPSGSMMSGYVLGSMANKSAKPYIANVDKFGVQFKDGTLLEYDQSTQTGVLKIGGGTPAITVNSERVQIDSEVIINGPTTINDVTVVNASTLINDTLDVAGATTLADNLVVMQTVQGMMTASFTGLVSAGGFGGPTAGSAAVMSGGAQMLGTVTIDGVEVAVISHNHTDAEKRPTSSAIQ